LGCSWPNKKDVKSRTLKTTRERSKTAPLKITRVRHPLVRLCSDIQLGMFLMLLKFSPPAAQYQKTSRLSPISPSVPDFQSQKPHSQNPRMGHPNSSSKTTPGPPAMFLMLLKFSPPRADTTTSKTAPLKITRVRHPPVHLRSDIQLGMFLMLLKFSPPAARRREKSQRAARLRPARLNSQIGFCAGEDLWWGWRKASGLRGGPELQDGAFTLVDDGSRLLAFHRHRQECLRYGSHYVAG
jgi:hypothetical protein